MNKPTPQTSRVLSLDAFRGMTILLMILVNNLGSYTHAPAQLLHARWHGCTLTDLVFPFFLFIMGSAMSFSFREYNKSIYFKIIKRTIILFSIGFAAHLIPHFNFGSARIFGILQRIALCYFFVSLLVIHTGIKTQMVMLPVLLLGYWAVMELVPFPGKGTDSWAYNSNLAQYIDTLILGKHTWKKGLEPEGIISTIPALSTTLFGYLTGKWLQINKTPRTKNRLLIIAATILLILAFVWSFVMPLNKQLWTSTYALHTAAIALYVLAILFFLIERKHYHALFYPAFVFGSNSLVIFVASSLMAKILYSVPVTTIKGKAISVKAYLVFFLQHVTTLTAGSLTYAVIYIVFWFCVALVLYKKKIFIKV